jgi:hypothetical protein
LPPRGDRHHPWYESFSAQTSNTVATAEAP